MINFLAMIYLLLLCSLVLSYQGYALQPRLKLEPLQTGPRNEADVSNFDSVFNNIRFGYENIPTQDKIVQKNSEQQLRQGYTSSALCYPQMIRPRGCEPLFNAEILNQDLFADPRFKQLPCVIDGSCPYAQFKCSRGHIWKAVPGSPVCFHCPICKTARKVFSRRRRPPLTRDQLVQSLDDLVTGAKGTVLSLHFDKKDKWGSSASIRCESGHEWTGTLRNVLVNKTWCPTCAKNKQKLTEEEMRCTAEKFGGRFLGYVDECDGAKSAATQDGEFDTGKLTSEPQSQSQRQSQRHRQRGSSMRSLNRKARWMCARGHEFIQYPGNIRRAPGGRRNCSWCPQCKKDGLKFIWTPITKQGSVC
jgi:hypothetical protein